MNRAIIGEALEQMGWLHDMESNTWAHEKCGGLEFNTAVVYAIRFGSATPPVLGDEVKVISGPFLGFEGTVESVDLAKNRVRTIVDVFGRTTPVDLQVQELEILRAGRK